MAEIRAAAAAYPPERRSFPNDGDRILLDSRPYPYCGVASSCVLLQQAGLLWQNMAAGRFCGETEQREGVSISMVHSSANQQIGLRFVRMPAVLLPKGSDSWPLFSIQKRADTDRYGDYCYRTSLPLPRCRRDCCTTTAVYMPYSHLAPPPIYPRSQNMHVVQKILWKYFTLLVSS